MLPLFLMFGAFSVAGVAGTQLKRIPQPQVIEDDMHLLVSSGQFMHLHR
jgi:hypothetical protein